MTADAPVLPTSDPPLARIDLPHGPLAYADEGPKDAPAIFAVHGIPGSGRDFRYLAPQLTGTLRLVRVDLPGFGASAPLDDAIETLPGRARVVIALADRLGIETFTVLGHSMGGGTALVAASRHAERVRGLILLASLALRLHRGLGASPWLFGLTATGLRVPPLRRLLVPWIRAEYRRRRFPGVDDMTAADFERQLRAIAAVDFSLLREAVRTGLPRALVAYARDDHMIETSVAEELAHAIPSARILAFDDGGHNLQKTRAVELGHAIREFAQ